MHATAARLGTTATTRVDIRKWHLVVLGFAICLTGVIIHLRSLERIEVQVVTPTYRDIERTVSSSGTVIPVIDFPARANFSGMVEKIDVQLGQQVHPGQLLLVMKDQYALTRLIKARADLESAEVNSQNVQKNGSQEDRIELSEQMVRVQNEQSAAAAALLTLKQLEKRGSVSGAEVAAGNQRLQAANNAMEALQARTTQRYSPTDVASWKDKVTADKAALAAEQVSYANSRITSPIAGTVYALPVAQYDFVSFGTDLLRVADLTRTHIFADFDAMDIGRLRVGESVTITWDGRPGQSWSGEVTKVPLAVSHTGSLNVGRATINIESPRGDLPIGTGVAVTITVDKHSHVLSIPHEALRTEGSAKFVYRVSRGRLVRTPVEVGIVTPLQAEITKGLEPGNEIALHALDGQSLKDDQSVTTVK